MSKLIKRNSKKAGLPPGTVVHIGDKSRETTKITFIDYDALNCVEKEIKTIPELPSFKEKTTVTWISIEGLQQVDLIQSMESYLGVHPLVLEDIVNTSQRPKMEDYGDYIFIVLKMFFIDEKLNELVTEQVSLILGPTYCFSFQEKESPLFSPIRERIRQGKGRIRKMGPDYLAYSLLDAIIDHYFVVLEKMGEKIEILEEKMIFDVYYELSKEVHLLKRDMIFLRRQILPLREVISELQRTDSRLINKDTSVYFRDLFDHAMRVMDIIESFRDILSGILEIFLSSLTNKMNEIMKVLTIFSTLFIPLTFLASIYGMNFKYMPELEWPWGYFVMLGVMAAVGITMLIYFRRKRWI